MNERHMKIMVPYEETTDTCPDCSNHPCDCGLPAGYTPTPRTDLICDNILLAIYADTSNQSHAHREEAFREIEQLETELAAVTEQRDKLAEAIERLKELPETWRNECQGNWLRGGVVLQLADDFDAAVKGGSDE